MRVLTGPVNPTQTRAGCGSPIKDTKWAASYGISGKAPILGYNPASYEDCCDRCKETAGCAKFTFLQRPASVGNLCYLYFAGANGIATLPSTFSTFYSGEGEHMTAGVSLMHMILDASPGRCSLNAPPSTSVFATRSWRRALSPSASFGGVPPSAAKRLAAAAASLLSASAAECLATAAASLLSATATKRLAAAAANHLAAATAANRLATATSYRRRVCGSNPGNMPDPAGCSVRRCFC